MFDEIILVILGCFVVIFVIVIVKIRKDMNDPAIIDRIVMAVEGLGIDRKIGEIKEQHASFQTSFEKDIGEMKRYASDVRDDYRNLDKLLRVPQQRGALGEIALESIISDQLPPEMFGIRKRVFGKNPDAYISSIAGLICIDSKFPLDNFKKMIEADDPSEKESYKAEFLKNIRGHLQKIKDDYINPQAGTADFAFAFIPSEGVYWYLISEMHDELMKWTKDGVQVVSPLTISSKISIIKAGVHAKKLSEDAGRVLTAIGNLGKSFESVDAEWKTFFASHFTNAWKKAQSVDESYKKLRQEFEKVRKLEE